MRLCRVFCGEDRARWSIRELWRREERPRGRAGAIYRLRDYFFNLNVDLSSLWIINNFIFIQREDRKVD